MSWLAAIRASRTVSLESAKDSTTNAGSGPISGASSKNADHDSSSAKTSQELFPMEALLPSWKTWKEWVTQRRRIKIPLLRLGDGTSARGSSLLPTLCRPNGGRTPKAGMSRTGKSPDGKKRQVDLQYIFRHNLFPTILRSDGAHGGPNSMYGAGNAKISKAIFTMPTLTKHGNYKRKGASKKSGDGLVTAMKMMPTLIKRDSRTVKGAAQGKNRTGSENLVTVIGGTLNPEWAEWYMGVRIGWTELDRLATLWFHNKASRSGKKLKKFQIVDEAAEQPRWLWPE